MSDERFKYVCWFSFLIAIVVVAGVVITVQDNNARAVLINQQDNERNVRVNQQNNEFNMQHDLDRPRKIWEKDPNEHPEKE